MGKSIGPTLKIDGFADYKRNIDALITQGKTLDSQMKLVESTWDKNTSAQEKAADKAKVLRDQIKNQREKVKQLTEIVEKATEKYGADSDEVRKWTTAQNKAQAELNHMQHELDDCNDALDENQDELKETGKEARSAKDKLSSFGKAAATAGAAAAAAFAAVVKGAVKVAKALADMTVNGAEYADNVLTQSTVTGIATDKLQEYMYAADLVDVSTETLTKSIAKNVKSMSEAAKGSGEYAEAYNRLGVSVTDANGDLRSSEQVFWETIDALGNVGNETERDALAMQIFGKSAQELNPLIKAGSDRMRELGEEARNAGAVMSGETLNAFGEFKDQLDRLKAGSEAAKRALGTALLPMLTELSQKGVSMLGDYTNALLECNGNIEQMAKVTGQFLGDAVQELSRYAPQLVDIALSAIDGLLDGLTSNLPEIIKSLEDGCNKITSSIVDFFKDTKRVKEIAKAGVQLLGSLTGNITDIVLAIAESLPDLITGICEELAKPEFQEMMLEAGIKLFLGLVSNVPAIVAALGKGIFGIVKGIAGGLAQLGQTVYDGSSEAFGKIGETSTGFKHYSGHFDVNDPSTQEAIKGFGELIDEAIARIETEGIKNAEDAIAGIKIAEGAIAGLTERYEECYDAAKTSIEGQFKLWDDVSQKADEVTMSVKDLDKAIESQIKYWRDYNKNLESLMDRNIDGLQEMVAAMDDGSAQSRAAIGALAGASDEDIERMISSWQSLQHEQDRAAQNTRDLQFDMEGACQDMANSVEKTVSEMDLGDEALSAAQNVISMFVKGLKGGKSAIEKAASGVMDAFYKNLKDTAGARVAFNFKVSPYASGTDYASPGLALVGENGPELMILRGGERILSAAQTMAAMSLPTTSHASGASSVTYTRSIGSVQIEVNAAPGQSPNEIADAVMDRINAEMSSETAVWR